MATVSETHLTDLASVLKSIGVDVRRADGREISGRCPVHRRVTGREDGSPSWSMNAQTGLWICFSCGARGTLSMLVSELTGEPDAIMAVHHFLIDRNLERLTTGVEVTEKKPEIDWVSFSKFVLPPESALSKRGLDPDQVLMHGVRWDNMNKAWVIPIVNHFGDLQGWQTKAPGWVRNFPVGVKKSDSLFGIERFMGGTAVLVESPLDVVRFASVFEKPQALATFGAAVSDKQLALLSTVADRVVIAMDNDEAGIRSSKSLFNRLPHFRRGTLWWNYSGTSAKDIGDMTASEMAHGLASASRVLPWTI